MSENEGAEKEEQYVAVDRLIREHLSPLQQTILYRREMDGEEIRSIASDLGMEEAAVRMNLSRARRTIKELYQKESSWKK